VKFRRHHLIIASVIILGITFLTIGVMHQREPVKYYAHSLRTWQEADSVAGYPIAVDGSDEGSPPEFYTTEFQPNLSTLSPIELFRLPVARGFIKSPSNEARAAGTGLVLFTGAPSGYEGKAVLLGHRLPDGSVMQTFYSGLTGIQVKVGEHVARGDLLGKGSLYFEVREGMSLDLAREEIAGFVLNSLASPAPPNRISTEDFFARHGLAEPAPDPLVVIQENEDRAAREKLGLE
jgi:hypothetical protein